MKLNKDFYSNKELEVLSQTQIAIQKIIAKYPEAKREERFDENTQLTVLYALSDVRKNIINWYPMNKQATVLELGSNLGEITGELCKKAKRVVGIESSMINAEIIAKRHENISNLEIIVGDLNTIELQEKFDYITLFGTIEKFSEFSIQELLDFLQKKYLKEKGKILIATNNDLAMMYLAGVEKESTQLLGLQQWEELFQKNQWQYKFYYMLPDYKLPNSIFTNEYLPNLEAIQRIPTYFSEEEKVNFSQKEQYLKLVQQNKKLFCYFVNSFFIEIAKELEENQIKFVLFENDRKPKYRLKLTFQKDKFYKTAIDEKANQHFEQMKQNINILKNKNIKLIDSYEKDVILSPYQENGIGLDEYLLQEYEKQGIQKVISIIQRFQKEVLDCLEKGDSQNTIFEKYKIILNHEEKEKLTFLKEGMWDLIFQNCFYKDNEFYIYDQEWSDKNTPLEFILYRNITSLKQKQPNFPCQKVLEAFDLLPYIPIFQQLEQKIQEEVKDGIIWRKHAKSMANIIPIKKRIQEFENVIQNRNEELQQARTYSKGLEILVQNKENHIVNLEKMLEVKDMQLNQVFNSRSWKFTKPLRKIEEAYRRYKDKNRKDE